MSIVLNDNNFEEEVINAKGLVLVDFYADWCGPCKMMSPIIEEIAEETKDSLKVGKLNIDESPEVSSDFGIMSIPTLLIFKDGEIAKSFVGVTSKNDILNAIKEL